MNRSKLLVCLMLIVALLLPAGCTPAPAPTPVKVTVKETVQVKETVVVKEQVVVTPTPAPVAANPYRPDKLFEIADKLKAAVAGKTPKGDARFALVANILVPFWTACNIGGSRAAAELGAELLVILMEADAVYRDFATPEAHRIARISAAEATGLAGGLPSGSVGPKLAAAGWFARRGGTAVICRAEDLDDALRGRAGTTVAPEM